MTIVRESKKAKMRREWFFMVTLYAPQTTVFCCGAAMHRKLNSVGCQIMGTSDKNNHPNQTLANCHQFKKKKKVKREDTDAVAMALGRRTLPEREEHQHRAISLRLHLCLFLVVSSEWDYYYNTSGDCCLHVACVPHCYNSKKAKMVSLSP